MTITERVTDKPQSLKTMHLRHLVPLLALAVLLPSAMAQSPASTTSTTATPPATSESRDASLAYVGTANFIVGRVGRDCLEALGRKETPQEFVATWQQRNSKYLMASEKYMGARLDEVQASGGEEKRKAALNDLLSVVRPSGEKTVASWLTKGDRQETCKRVVALVDTGAFDLSRNSSMLGELDALVEWAKH